MSVHPDWGARDPRWRGIRSDVVEVRGVPVHVLRAAGRGTGVPHLLLHGLGGYGTDWLEVMAGLAELGPVVAPDLPGFGETPVPPGGSARVRANAGFVPALARALGWDHLVLHGNSMGGTIATMVGARQPHLVDRLVLVSPGLPAAHRDAFRSADPVAWGGGLLALPVPGRAAAMRFGYRARSADEIVAIESALVFHTELRPALHRVKVEQVRRARDLEWRSPAFVAAAESLIALIGAGRTLRRDIAEVIAPTLVVRGRQDRLVKAPVTDELRRRRPDWRIVEPDGTGHCTQLERPDRYLDEVRSWLGTPATATR